MPQCTDGVIFCPGCWPGGTSGSPSIVGTDGPYTSASSSPTVAPCCRSASARLVATVDLPTPPLPAATAMMFLTPASRSPAGLPILVVTSALTSSLTPLAPAPLAASLTACSISSLCGCAGVGSFSLTCAVSPSPSTSLT